MGENRLRRTAGVGLVLTAAAVWSATGLGVGCSGCNKKPAPTTAVETVPRESLFVTDRGDTITADSARRYRAMMAALAAEQQRRNDSIQAAFDAEQAAKARASNRTSRRRTPAGGGSESSPRSTEPSTAGLRDHRTEGEIEAVANRHDRDVRLCLETYKRDFPTASGEISLTMNITPEGNVSSVNVVNRGNLDAKTVRCVTTRIRSWSFERVKPSAGTYTTGRYSYHY